MTWRLGLAAACAVTALTAGCASTGGDVAALAEADQGPPICREILTPGSNVLSTVCMVQSEWDEYELERRRQSQELTRRLQGFSGGF